MSSTTSSTTSPNKLGEFQTAANTYLEAHTKDGAETKATYAIRRVLSQGNRLGEKIQNHLADIEVEFCLVEDRGEGDKVKKDVICRDERGQLEYTRPGLRDQRKKKQEYVDDESALKFEPHFIAVIPDDITYEDLLAFTGFIIRPADAEAFLERREQALDEAETKTQTATAETPENGADSQPSNN